MTKLGLLGMRVARRTVRSLFSLSLQKFLPKEQMFYLEAGLDEGFSI